MSTRFLPPRPNLAQLKLQANDLRRSHRQGDRSTAARIVAHHPRMRSRTPRSVLDGPLSLADAQLVIAREYGFDSWARLKHHVETASRVAVFAPHPDFDRALAALDAGDQDQLRQMIAEDFTLIRARTNLDPPYNYFTGATLLHHVAGNPNRGPLSKNIVEMARLLLDAGADVHAQTLGPSAGTTMGLLCTSKQASDRGVTGPLIDLLLERGASLDLKGTESLDGALANHAPRAAEKMIELGARADVITAAALGRLDLLRAAFDQNGACGHVPRRRGKTMPERDAVGLALLFAYVREQSAAVDFLLEKNGNWNMTGVNNGTALHRAAWAGDLAMVERLVAKGADLSDRNNPFTSTPFSWANHNKQAAVCQWMRSHCAIDLHDAVSFDLREHIEARLREDAAAVDRRIDHWDVPLSTALHVAARQRDDREEAATMLLEAGADPNIVAGNGCTALDFAEQCGAAGVASLLKQRGGKRAADLA